MSKSRNNLCTDPIQQFIQQVGPLSSYLFFFDIILVKQQTK